MPEPSPPEKAQIVPGLFVERESATEAELREAGVDLARDFPGASLDEFRRYPVLSEGGWFMVIKHQPTLKSVSRVKWRLLGPVALASDGLSLD
jgi:hypothetical protein